MDNCCSTDLDGVFTKLGPRRNLPFPDNEVGSGSATAIV